MPVWTPGYYRIMDYAKFVKDFRAEDGMGRALPFEKTAKNTWRVRTGKASSIVVSYDIYAFTRFVADSYLGDDGEIHHADRRLHARRRPLEGPGNGHGHSASGVEAGLNGP